MIKYDIQPHKHIKGDTPYLSYLLCRKLSKTMTALKLAFLICAYGSTVILQLSKGVAIDTTGRAETFHTLFQFIRSTELKQFKAI